MVLDPVLCMEYYSAIRKDEILPFATTWMDLEYHAKAKCQKKLRTIWFHHMWDIKLKFTGTGNNMVVTSGKRGGSQ